MNFLSWHSLNIFFIKVGIPWRHPLYTKGSTLYEATSQYGDLNILWICSYRSTLFYVIIAQWSMALVLWAAYSEFNPPETFLKKNLKSYFNQKVMYRMLFGHYYLLIVTSFFIIKLFCTVVYLGHAIYLFFFEKKIMTCSRHNISYELHVWQVFVYTRWYVHQQTFFFQNFPPLKNFWIRACVLILETLALSIKCKWHPPLFRAHAARHLFHNLLKCHLGPICFILHVYSL